MPRYDNQNAGSVDDSQLGIIGSQLGTNSEQHINGPGFASTRLGGRQNYDAQAQAAQNQQAAQIQNPYADEDRIGASAQDERAVGGRLSAIADGYAPSIGAAQMSAATDQGIRAQMAMANSARGSLAGALAQRGAQQSGVDMMQNAAQQSAVIKAQEAQSALGQLATLTGQQRSQSLQQESLDNQQSLAQAQLQAQQNALNQQGALGYTSLGVQAQTADMQGRIAQNQAALGAQGQGLQQSEFNAQQNSNMLAGLVGAAGGIAQGVVKSDERLKTDVADASTGIAGKPAAPDAGDAERERSARADAIGQAFQDSSASLRGNGAVAQLAPLTGQMVSDERLKSSRAPGHAAADEFLDSLHPYSYRYSNPADEPRSQPNGGRYLGVMAQNLEMTPAGRQIVRDTPGGKALEQGPLVSALAAGEGQLHERLNRLEWKLGLRGG